MSSIRLIMKIAAFSFCVFATFFAFYVVVESYAKRNTLRQIHGISKDETCKSMMQQMTMSNDVVLNSHANELSFLWSLDLAQLSLYVDSGHIPHRRVLYILEDLVERRDACKAMTLLMSK